MQEYGGSRLSKDLLNEFNGANSLEAIMESVFCKIDNYKKEVITDANIEKMKNLYYGIYYYLYNYRPVSEQTYDSVLKLTGASKYAGYTTSPFIKIIENFNNSLNEEERKIYKKIYEITDKDVDDALDFIIYMLNKEQPDDLIEALGYIIIIRNYCVKSILIEKNDEETAERALEKLSPEMLSEFEAFIEKYKPVKIKEYLDEYIIGQDSAKKNVSSAVFNHVLRALYPQQNLNKSNVLLIGPSGCGKTEIVRRLKEMFKENNIDIPIVISDFSGVVATPWKGRNKEETLARLFEEAGCNLTKAEHGIIFLDEFDKIIPKVAGGARGYDYNNELQGQMLGMLEGTSCQVHVSIKRDSGNKEADILMRTDNILFILAGAFDGLEDVICRNGRADENVAFGIASTKKKHIDFSDENVTVENLIEYGFRAELAGRIGNPSVLYPLSRENMINILKNAKDSIIEKYQNAMFAEDGIELEFEEGAYGALADKVQGFCIGARGLNAILHDVLSDVMFEAPSIPGLRKVVISEDTINGKAGAIYIND